MRFLLMLLSLAAGLSLTELLLSFNPVPEYRMDTSSTLAKVAGWGPTMKNDKPLCDTPHIYDNPNKKIRVLLMGDSELDCNETTQLYQNTVPAILQKMLGPRYEVINISAGGWGTDQEYLAYQAEGIKYKPDYTFVFFTPANDVYNNQSTHAIGSPASKPVWDRDQQKFVWGHKITHPRWWEHTQIYKRLFPLVLPDESNAQTITYKLEGLKFIDGWGNTGDILKMWNFSAMVYVPTGLNVDKCYGYNEISPKGYDILLPYNILKKLSYYYKFQIIDNIDQVKHYDMNRISPDCLHMNKLGSALLAGKVYEYIHR